MGRDCLAHGALDARGACGGRFVLARARDCREGACGWMGYNRNRANARYRVADNRRAQRARCAGPMQRRLNELLKPAQMLSSPTLAIRLAALPCGFLIRSKMMFVSSI